MDSMELSCIYDKINRMKLCFIYKRKKKKPPLAAGPERSLFWDSNTAWSSSNSIGPHFLRYLACKHKNSNVKDIIDVIWFNNHAWLEWNVFMNYALRCSNFNNWNWDINCSNLIHADQSIQYLIIYYFSHNRILFQILSKFSYIRKFPYVLRDPQFETLP